MDLVRVVKTAITISKIDFTVIEGVRSLERQKQLLIKRKTTTMRSRHLTGHAVDLGAWVDNTVYWDWEYYEQISDAMKHAAAQEKVKIEWGGDWTSFKDGPHLSLIHI